MSAERLCVIVDTALDLQSLAAADRGNQMAQSEGSHRSWQECHAKNNLDTISQEILILGRMEL